MELRPGREALEVALIETKQLRRPKPCRIAKILEPFLKIPADWDG